MHMLFDEQVLCMKLIMVYLLQVLARELVGQLQVLESNAHPFYKPRNFVVC